MTSKDSQPAAEGPLRRRAEEILAQTAGHSPQNLGARPPEEAARTLHELQVHQIELEMQNEELRRAQAELEEARARYFDLYDLAPAAYLTVSETGLVRESNLTAATLLGVARGALVAQPISRFILKEDQDIFYRHRKDLAATGAAQAYDLRMVKRDGSVFWGHLEAAAAKDGAGAPACRILLNDISEQKQAEIVLKDSLREKESVIKEIHHRVKNNLQVISSLLRLQSARIESPAAKGALHDMQDRVRSMALIHEHLYHSNDPVSVNLAEYLTSLCQQLFHALVTVPGALQLHLDLAPVRLAIDQALPCGLLVSELVSNAIKHAFPDGRTGEVRVALHPVAGTTQLRLSVADNGAGLPAGFALDRITTLGLRLVPELARQLCGRLEISRGPGAVFDVIFQKAP